MTSVAAGRVRYPPYVVAVALGALGAAWSSVADPLVQAAAVAGVAFLSVALWTLGKPDRWVLLFLGMALCLPPLPFAIGDSGPHPAIAAAALGLAVGALRGREWQGSVPRAALWLLLYPLALLSSVPFAAVYSGLSLAAASLARVLLFGISIYVFFYVACGPDQAITPDKTKQRSERFLFYAGVVSALFACFDFFYQLPAPAGFGAQFVWLESGVYRRAQGIFYEASTLGNVCVFFLVFIGVCLSRRTEESPIGRPALLGGTIAFSAALLLSFSRASVVNLCVAAAMFPIVARVRLRLMRLTAILTLGGSLGVLFAYAFFPAIVEFYWLRLRTSVELLWSGNEAALSGRLDTWKVLLEFLLDHPWHAILGVGYKTLPYSDFIGRPAVADNAYLSSLLETGLIGLVLLLLFHTSILRMGWQAARSSNQRAAFFGTWITCFWAGEIVQMLSGDLLTYWRVLPAYLWVLGMAVRYSRQRGADEHPVSRPVQ
jgi:O-antigen ligase